MNTQTAPSRSMYILDNTGDTRIGWDESEDEKLKAIITAKLAQGVRFFIIKPVAGGLWYRRSYIKNVADLKDREVRVLDKDFAQLFETGAVAVDQVRSDGNSLNTVKASKDADEIAKSHSVAVKPLMGG